MAAWVCCLTLPVPTSAAPVNDSFANAITLSGVTSVTGSNVGATAEPGEPAHAGEDAQNSVWWRWTAPFDATFSISTSNSTFDTVLAVYAGKTLNQLVPVFSNDDFDFGILWSRVFFRAYAGESFYLAVDGSGGNTGSVRLNIGLIPNVMSPWDATSTAGQTLSSSNFAGKVLLIDFWETTCGTCVDELPYLISLHNRLAPQGFSIIGLATDHDPALVTTFLSEWNVSYPMGLHNTMTETALAGTVGTLANPTKFLVDRDGRVAARYPGANSITLYEDAALALLRPPPPPVLLEITQTGGTVTISWPIDASDYALQATTRFPAPGWGPVNAPVEVVDGKNVTTVSADGPVRFFRLKKP